MSDEAGNARDEALSVAPAWPVARWLTKARIVASSIGLYVRLTASFVAAAYDGWIRKQRTVLRKLKEVLVAPSLLVLSSKISLPSTADGVPRRARLESVIQALSGPITRTSGRWFPGRSSSEAAEPEPEKSVHVEVLHDPSPQAIRADVIFIHGLHGSLFNTWKQGLWSHRKQVQNLPLEHKYGLEEAFGRFSPRRGLKDSGKEGERAGDRGQTDRGQSDEDYDHLLENITDLINNIDDKTRESQGGGVAPRAEQEPYSPCWPRDWLPKDCPGVRVIAVNYTTDPFLWRPVWIAKRIRSSMPQRSRQMEDVLLDLGVGEHPIVWVGHSKGGLFVKQMLVDARNSEEPRLRSLLERTKGIMFYSVPHRGSSLAHWNLPLLRQSIELTEVQKDCREVLELHRKFMSLYEEKALSAEVFSFVETVLTFMFVTNVRVVSVDSADLGLGSFQGVNIDHREICKPLNRDCFLYKELTSLIHRVL